MGVNFFVVNQVQTGEITLLLSMPWFFLYSRPDQVNLKQLVTSMPKDTLRPSHFLISWAMLHRGASIGSLKLEAEIRAAISQAAWKALPMIKLYAMKFDYFIIKFDLYFRTNHCAFS